MQQILQNMFFIKQDEGIEFFIVRIVGIILVIAFFMGLAVYLVKLLVNIDRLNKTKNQSICRAFSKIVRKIEVRKDFFKKTVFLIVPVGVIFVAGIILMLMGVGLIGDNSNADFDTLCTIGVIMFIGSFIYFTALYFKRGNYEALSGFFENKMKEYLPSEWEVTDTYQNGRLASTTARDLNLGKNVSRGAENVFIVLMNIMLFFINIVMFVIVNLIKALIYMVETPFCLNLRDKAKSVLRKHLFSQEEKATILFLGVSTNEPVPYPHSELEVELYMEEISEIMKTANEKIKNREDCIDIIVDNRQVAFERGQGWSNDFKYYHTVKLIKEERFDDGYDLIYETNLGVLLVTEHFNGIYATSMMVPFNPAQNWLDAYNKSNLQGCVRKLQNVYIAYKKQENSSAKLTLVYDETPFDSKSNAFVISARLSDITPNEDVLEQFTVSDFKKIRSRKNDSYGGTIAHNNTGKSNQIAVVGFIFSFLMPIVGLILCTVGYSRAKKENLGHKKLSMAGIIVSFLILVLGVFLNILD